jgi:hypothetical protein
MPIIPTSVPVIRKLHVNTLKEHFYKQLIYCSEKNDTSNKTTIKTILHSSTN